VDFFDRDDEAKPEPNALPLAGCDTTRGVRRLDAGSARM